MKKLLSQLLITALSTLLSLPASASPDAKQPCTRQALHTYRTTTFTSLMTAKRYAEAADQLTKFLDDNSCWEALVGPLTSGGGSSKEVTSDQPKDAEEFLWAHSDLALAFLKDNRPGRCLEIVKVELSQYFFNPLEEVDSPKLKQAYETNEALCQKRQLEMFPPLAGEKCALGELPKSVTVSDDDLSGTFGVQGIDSAIKVPAETGFSCVAVVALSTMKGILQGFCDSEKACRESGDPDDIEPTSISEVFGITASGALRHLSYLKEEGWCGNPQVSLHKDALGKSEAVIVRIAAPISPCLAGTARADVDSFFVLKEGALTPRDTSYRGYH